MTKITAAELSNNSLLSPFMEFDIHRVNAGVISANGEYPALSRTQRFTVNFPTPYSEWSVESEYISASNFSANTADGVEFIVLEYTLKESEQVKSIKKLTRAILTKPSRRSIRAVNHRGMKGAQTKTISNSQISVYRFFLTQTHLYQLTVKYPQDERKLGHKLLKPFFKSFQLLEAHNK